MNRAAIALVLVVAQVRPVLAEVGRATIFARAGDKRSGGAAACTGRMVQPTDMVIAHRRLRCGTRVKVTSLNTGRSVVATVVDRGPFGACFDPGWRRGHCVDWRVKIRAGGPGLWRGIADLSPVVAAAIGHKSHGRVRIEVAR